MNIPFERKRFVQAVKNFILLSGALHIIILVCYVLLTGRYQFLNYFKVLDIDLFLPFVDQSDWFFLGSVIVIIVLVFLFYRTGKKR